MNRNLVKKKEASENEINIIPILKEIVKKIWLILLVGLIVGGAVFVAGRVFVKPTYRSGFTAYVNNKQSKQNTDFLTSSDVTASKEIVQTYQKIITSNTILTASAKSIKFNQSYDNLQKMVYTEIMDETEIISIYVIHTDPKTAYEYASAISQTAPKYMTQIVEGSSMKIIDYPEYSEKRFKPSYIRFGLIGFIVGALLVTVIIIIRFFMDDTINNKNEIEDKFSIPILGVIPDISRALNSKSDYYYSYYGTDQKGGHDEKKEEQ